MTNTNIVNAGELSRVANEIINQWLEKDYLPSVDKLKTMGWNALPVADFMNPMEAEWLADTIGNRAVVGLNFDFEGTPEVKLIDSNRDSLINYNVSNSHRYVCLTSKILDFLYFKDDVNRFYLLCGDEDFIRSAYKCSRDTAKVMYLDYWVDSHFNSQEEKDFLVEIWEKYSI